MISGGSDGRGEDAPPINIRRIERITRSHIFQGADALCKLLYFLAEKANIDAEYSAKEHEIATIVFGRKADFDPRTDSSVRVQVARLRAKLIEYYTREGAEEDVQVEIPKGAYRLQYVTHPKAAEPDDVLSEREVERSALVPGSPLLSVPGSSLFPSAEAAGSKPPGSQKLRRRFVRWPVFVLVLTALLLGSFLGRYSIRAHSSTTEVKAMPPDSALRTFWHVFAVDPKQTWVIFSNARFVGNAVGGLRYFDPRRDTPENTHAFYTGVGEVMGVHLLDQMFTGFGRSIRVKRSALLSLEDVKDTNLIFLGAPVENLTLANLATLHSFQFQEISSGVREGQVEILNKEPRATEQPVYMISSVPLKPLVDDYAVVAMLPGITPSHRIFVAAGTTTIGTQAAVEYVCNPDGVADLMKQLGRSGTEQPFEVLLHVTIVNDVPIETRIMIVHKPHLG
ncbi:MAG TPA: helix-turn-helix domain-containing protein [Terracidiphilus sp.]|jgi:hypothetical protein